MPLAEVLQLLQDQTQTGVLAITRGARQVDVYFRQGKVETPRDRGGVSEEFLLGRFILDNNLMAGTTSTRS